MRPRVDDKLGAGVRRAFERMALLVVALENVECVVEPRRPRQAVAIERLAAVEEIDEARHVVEVHRRVGSV